jgi:hypothetical protein
MPNKLALPKQAAHFIETMDRLPVSKLYTAWRKGGANGLFHRHFPEELKVIQ